MIGKTSNEFGLNLRDARQKAGLSQGDLAKQTGLVPAEISHLECGRRDPSWKTFCLLVRALSAHGVSADDFVVFDNLKGYGV